MKVFATGASASGAKEYLSASVPFGEKHQKKILVYNLGELLKEIAKDSNPSPPINWNNILNAEDARLADWKAAVFKEIILGKGGRALSRAWRENDAIIIRAPASFYWNECGEEALDFSYIKKFNPDIFVTFIDGSAEILSRLKSRDQWRYQNLNTKDVLIWQNFEVVLTRSLARWHGKPFYVIASGQPLATLHNIMFYPDVKKVYASIPITHLRKKEDHERIHNFISELSKYFIVFNPLTVDIAKEDGAEELKIKGFIIESAENKHTVMRDIKWLLRQSDINTVYFPRVVPSPGVIDERHSAFRNTQDVWVIHPKEASPFMELFKTAPELFHEPEQFFKFIREEYFKGNFPKLVYSMETYEDYSEL